MKLSFKTEVTKYFLAWKDNIIVQILREEVKFINEM